MSMREDPIDARNSRLSRRSQLSRNTSVVEWMQPERPMQSTAAPHWPKAIFDLVLVCRD